MIRALRRRHRLLFTALAPLLALLFAAALTVRPSRVARLEPGSAQLPEPARIGPTAEPAQSFGRVGEPAGPPVHGMTTWPGLALDLRVDPQSEAPYIDLLAHEEINSPDLLLYWQETDPAGQSHVAPSAVLLGGVNGAGSTRIAIPGHATTGGHLVLYSLGHEILLGSMKLPMEPGGH